MPRYASLMRKFTRTDITQFLNKSRVVLKQAGLVIRAAPAQKAWGRIVIIVPRRFGNSPQRHLVKRQVRALFYEKSYFEQPYDMAIFLYKPIDFASLQNVFTQAYSQVTQLFLNRTL